MSEIGGKEGWAVVDRWIGQDLRANERAKRVVTEGTIMREPGRW